MGQASFTDYLVGLGLSPRTVNLYHAHVQKVTVWFDNRGLNIDDPTASDVAAFAATVSNSHSSRGQLRCALKHYWAWQGTTGPSGAVRVPPAPRMICLAIEDEEARLLVKTARGWYPQGTAVLIGLYLALRRFEIAKTRWDRLDVAGGWYVVTGKMDLTARLPAHPVLLEELGRVPHRGDYVFPGRGQRPHVTPATVWAWSREVATMAGLAPLPPHRLRHTALATANDRLGDLRAVQTFARHARPDTTAGYTRTTARRLREVSDSLDYM